MGQSPFSHSHYLQIKNTFQKRPSRRWDLATHLRSHGVFDAHHTQAGESSEDVVLVVPVRLALGGSEVPVGQADGPQPLRGHGLNHLLHHVVPVPRSEHFGLAARRQDLIAPG